MSGRTRSLFHFTKELKTLKAILNSGCFKPSYCAEDTTWFHGDLASLYIPMTCFCDIPLGRIREHTDDYGFYGIGLTQDWGKQNGLNPVLYLNTDSPLKGQLERLRDKALSIKDDEGRREEFFHHLSLIAYVKPIEGVPRVGKPPPKFYKESEWRYVPPNLFGTPEIALPYLSQLFGSFQERGETLQPLRFTPDDIRYIFVESTDEIPGFIDFIDELAHCSVKDRKILHSRVLALKDAQEDW